MPIISEQPANELTPPGLTHIPPRFPIVPFRGRPNPTAPIWTDYRKGAPKRNVGFTGFFGAGQGFAAPGTPPFVAAPVTDDTIEPPGGLPTHKRGRLSGWGEPVREHDLDVVKIRSAIAAAERGETTRLFVIYRDFVLEGSHLQTEFGKRKMSVLGQPHSIKAWKAKGAKVATAQDQKAADDIERMIDNCENWERGLVSLMDAALWPVAVAEKIFDGDNPDPANLPGIRFKFRRFDAVSHFLECYRLAYIAAGGFQLPGNIAPKAVPMQINQPGDTIWNPDSWEPDLRFFRTLPNGMIDYSWGNIYAPDPIRHIVHRGNILSESIRDNYGAVMRALLFWHLFIMLGRDWWARGMNKYGTPFIVAKANMQQKDTFDFLKEAFRQCVSIGGLLVNKDADVQLSTAVGNNISQGYEIFIKFCNAEISKLVLGHEGSSTAKSEGLNSSQEKSVDGASEMIRTFDQIFLKSTLERQLFTPYLRMNGQMTAHTPTITWGGLSNDDLTAMFEQIATAKQAGLQLTDDGVEAVNATSGLTFERVSEPEPELEPEMPGGNPKDGLK